MRAVSRFFKRVVDSLPLPQVYFPELAEVANIRHPSVRKIIDMKGKNIGAVITLRNIINAKNWTDAWVSLVIWLWLPGTVSPRFTGEPAIKRDLI